MADRDAVEMLDELLKGKKPEDKSGEIAIEVPRDRNGYFEPQIVLKGRRRPPGLDDKVIALCARGILSRGLGFA